MRLFMTCLALVAMLAGGALAARDGVWQSVAGDADTSYRADHFARVTVGNQVITFDGEKIVLAK